MFGLADRGNKKKAVLVWIMFWNHLNLNDCDRQGAAQTNENPETLVNKCQTETSTLGLFKSTSDLTSQTR